MIKQLNTNPMTKKTIIPIALAAVMAIGCISCNREVQFGKSPIKKVVAAMTLEEKVNLLIGVGAWNGADIAQEIQDAKNLIPGCAGQTYPIPRLGIPSVMLPDGPVDSESTQHVRVMRRPIIAHHSRLQPCLPRPGTSLWSRRLE